MRSAWDFLLEVTTSGRQAIRINGLEAHLQRVPDGLDGLGGAFRRTGGDGPQNVRFAFPERRSDEKGTDGTFGNVEWTMHPRRRGVRSDLRMRAGVRRIRPSLRLARRALAPTRIGGGLHEDGREMLRRTVGSLPRTDASSKPKRTTRPRART